MVNRLLAIIKQKGLSVSAVEKQLGFGNGAIKRFSTSSPSIDKIIALSNFLNVTVEYILFGNENVSELPEDIKKLVEYYKTLSDKDKGMVLGKAETLAELAAERAAKERAAKHPKKAAQIAAPAADEQPEPEDNEPEQPLIKIMHSFYKVSAGRGFDLSGDDDWEEIEIPDTHEARKADYALTIQGDSMEPIYYDGDIVLVKKQDAVEIGQVGIFVLDGSGFIKKYNGDRLISLNEKYDDILLEDYNDCRCDGRVIGRV